jgi:large subunit ribosomal protein L18
MNKSKHKAGRRQRRRIGIRKRVTGGADRPRLAVFRSLNHMYVQVIDDLSGRTIASASTREAGVVEGAAGNIAAAKKVGEAIAKKATAAGVKEVVFDRSGFRYHGRVKALADAAREGGLKF